MLALPPAARGLSRAPPDRYQSWRMKQRSPPASERDLDRKTRDQALRLVVLIMQLCALALSPLSELQSPPGLKAESSPAYPHC